VAPRAERQSMRLGRPWSRAARTVAGRAALVAGTAIAIAGCSAYLQGLARWKPQHGSDEIVLYGGPDHATYLGCVNCSRYDSESVLNTDGPYGRSDSGTSIANPSSIFGSPYSEYSACNLFATDPPIIVDDQGTYYGRLSINLSQPGPPSDALQAWIIRLCRDGARGRGGGSG
jgi:hypothetical protein